MIRILAMISLAAFAASDAAAQTSYKSRWSRKPAAQNEMQVIQLQNTVSQRQRILQTSKRTLDSTQCKNCAQNIR